MKLIEPFNLAGREKVEAGLYRVITRDGKPVRIVCWDKKGKEPVCALVSVGAGYEHWQLYEPNGRVYPEGYENSDDLFFTYEVPDNPQDDLFTAMMSFQEDSIDYPGNLIDIINNHRNEILTTAAKVLKTSPPEMPRLRKAEGPMHVLTECLVVNDKGDWYVGHNIEKGMRYIPMRELVDILTKE